MDPVVFGLLSEMKTAGLASAALWKKGGKFFHASPKKFNPRDVLKPQGGGNYGKTEDFVFFSPSEIPHRGISNSAYKQDWNVYEVAPKGDVRIGPEMDLFSPQASVVRRVGSSRKIMDPLLQKRRAEMAAQFDELEAGGSMKLGLGVGGGFVAGQAAGRSAAETQMKGD